ncbi:HAMP domain-containing sensor histidine kinase [Bacillus sp. FJAT-52991]|uniref:histidine kinase n=1 Tax=Bacillus kandeliae TaxID=3129297 RepID=A0ABZ2NBM1_9BACI
MESTRKLVKRFVAILLLSSICIIALNIFIFYLLGRNSINQIPKNSPWNMAVETSNHLQKTEDGYILKEATATKLKNKNIWAILIENETGQVIWSQNLPKEIPTSYHLSEIAELSRTYVKDYPTYTSAHEDGLIVLGYPKQSYWKLVHNDWEYSFIKHFPLFAFIIITSNILLILIIYLMANTKLLRSVNPILEGIEALPTEKDFYVKETGTLSEIASYINRTSEVLRSQDDKLKKKEMARANWIAGVSHDIRTPLSMVMGYAGQLENDTSLREDTRKKAAVIRTQSMRMKNLINDLNLASKLEYNMQPINLANINVVALVRQTAVDFINSAPNGDYPIEWNTSDELTSCFIKGDASLLKRAVANLVQNSQSHNPDGCVISLSVSASNDHCTIVVEDNGVGVNDEQLQKLREAPHYMVCDSHTDEQRHGLGLLIVKQITTAHHGNISINHCATNGFSVSISFPKSP